MWISDYSSLIFIALLYLEELRPIRFVEVVHLDLDDLVRVVEGHVVLVFVRDPIPHVDFVAREYLPFRRYAVVLHQ